MIRSFYPKDLKRIEELHEQFYKNEFSFPDFYKNFLCLFTIVENDEIILSGGLKLMLEAVAITDKSKSPRIRRTALLELLEAYAHMSRKCNFNQIHTTVIDDIHWEEHLMKVGFRHVKGDVLVLNI